MQLQIAADLLENPNLDEAIKLCDQIKDYVDIIELDHVMISEGPKIIATFKERYPDKIFMPIQKLCFLQGVKFIMTMVRIARLYHVLTLIMNTSKLLDLHMLKGN